jgi:hypothetical protein
MSNLNNIQYSGGDITIMQKIGTVTTKPKRIRFGFNSDSSTFDVVEITNDNNGEKVYVCNFWYKENIPHFVLESQALNFTSLV